MVLFDLLNNMVVHVSQLVQSSSDFRVHRVDNLAENCLEDVYKLFFVYLKVMSF